jgi:antitoxin MazE
MITRIRKWGNSQGLRFPLELLKQASISVGEEVDISAKSGSIIVKPAARNRGKYRLKDLVDKMPRGYKVKETDWGKPVGKEVW